MGYTPTGRTTSRARVAWIVYGGTPLGDLIPPATRYGLALPFPLTMRIRFEPN